MVRSKKKSKDLATSMDDYHRYNVSHQSRCMSTHWKLNIYTLVNEWLFPSMIHRPIILCIVLANMFSTNMESEGREGNGACMHSYQIRLQMHIALL